MSDEEILAATARTIFRIGPTRLTLSAVAADAGLSPSSLVQRFGSKRGLMLAFSRSAAHGLAERFTADRAAHASPLAALRASLIEMTAGITTAPTLANHLAFLALELGDPELRRETRKHATSMLAQIRVLLAEAIEAGELADADPERLAETIYVTYNGALISWAILRKGSLSSWLGSALDSALSAYAPSTTVR